METNNQVTLEKNTESKKLMDVFNWNIAIQDEFKKMWETRNNYDFKLIVGPENTEFRVHRSVLFLWSPVLSMLTSTEESIVIKDFSADTVKLYIQFAYTGEYTVCGQNNNAQPDILLELLTLAERFKFNALKNKCALDLQSGICLEKVLGIFKTAFACGHVELKNTCLQFMCRNGSFVLGQDQLLVLPEGCLELLLKQKSLSVNSELEVFRALLRWGSAQSCRKNSETGSTNKVSNVIQPLLKYVRFPLMNYNDFERYVLPSKVLTQQDMENILLGVLKKFEITALVSEENKPLEISQKYLPTTSGSQPQNLPLKIPPANSANKTLNLSTKTTLPNANKQTPNLPPMAKDANQTQNIVHNKPSTNALNKTPSPAPSSPMTNSAIKTSKIVQNNPAMVVRNQPPSLSLNNPVKTESIPLNLAQSNPLANARGRTLNIVQNNLAADAKSKAPADANKDATETEQHFIVGLLFVMIAFMCWYAFKK